MPNGSDVAPPETSAPRARREAVVIASVTLGLFLLLSQTNTCDKVLHYLYHEDTLHLDAALLAVMLGAIGMGIFAYRRWREAEREMHARRVAERVAMELAQHDALTGLPNRRHHLAELGRTLASDKRGALALLLLDLDRFKAVNDLHGHPAGDRLLQEVAFRLRAVLREGDQIARLGGDEFALVVPCGNDPIEQAARLARRIVGALTQPVRLDGVTVQTGTSIGIAIAEPGSEDDATALMHRADLALYRAKQEGRGGFNFFEAGMDAAARERGDIEAALRAAIAADQVEAHFQPLVSIDTGELLGFEALARWHHAERGMVAPSLFVPIAEDSGLIGPLTERILRRACQAAREWPEHLLIAINISPSQLRDRALPRLIREVLAECGLPARRLELEVTEGALIGNLDLAREVLNELKDLGLRLALDDFGTGYSSLAHLQALPFDKIKIDARFVRAMSTDPGSRKIVAAVIGLGHSLGVPTVAEGVEDARDAAELRALGCDVGQGWLFGRPVAPEGLGPLLAAGRAAPGMHGDQELTRLRDVPQPAGRAAA